MANGRTQLHRNAAFQFNGQIGNASAGIQLKGPVIAPVGQALMQRVQEPVVPLRLIGRQFQGGDDLRKEKPIPELTTDQVRVLADKTEARSLREIRSSSGPVSTYQSERVPCPPSSSTNAPTASAARPGRRDSQHGRRSGR
jgi:hypothetical protein